MERDTSLKMKLWGDWRGDRVALVVVGLLVIAAVIFVDSSLNRPEVSTFSPTQNVLKEVGGSQVGPRTVTVDASDGGVWRYFDFSRNAVVEAPGPTEWDIAFRRFSIMVNGGAAFHGEGGVLSLGGVPFDSVALLPTEGYVVSGAARDSVNSVIERWYDYGWSSHLLTPKADVYALRTADGRYAKLQLVGYYCPGPVAGCVTFRYVYQGGGAPYVATQ